MPGFKLTGTEGSRQKAKTPTSKDNQTQFKRKAQKLKTADARTMNRRATLHPGSKLKESQSDSITLSLPIPNARNHAPESHSKSPKNTLGAIDPIEEDLVESNEHTPLKKPNSSEERLSKRTSTFGKFSTHKQLNATDNSSHSAVRLQTNESNNSSPHKSGSKSRVDDLKLRINKRISEIKQNKQKKKITKAQALRTQTLKELFDNDPEIEVDPSKEENLVERMALQSIKYIRLMRLLQVEKSKVEDLQEIERYQRALIQKDAILLEELKQTLEELTNNAKNLDEEKLVKANKLIEFRKQVAQASSEKLDSLVKSDIVQPEGPQTDQAQPHPQPLRRGSQQIQSPKNQLSLLRRGAFKPFSPGGSFAESISKRLKTKFTAEEVGGATDELEEVKQQAEEKSPPENSSPQDKKADRTSYPNRFANAPILGRRRDNLIKRENPMIELLAKLKKSLAKINKMKDIMPLKIILKGITSFYNEKLAAGKENLIVREQDMPTFIYNTFLHTYGLPKFAESKFLKFMISVKKYSAIERVELFARMCCLMDNPSRNLTADETKQYFLGLEYLQNNNSLGFSIANSDNEKRHYTPFLRASEFARVYCEQRGLQKEYEVYKNRLEKSKEIDPTHMNKGGIIRIDLFLAGVIELHKLFKAKGEKNIKAVFDACNFDGNIVLSFDEFSVLVKNIEPDRFDLDKIEDVYAANEELLDEENQGISFKRFVTLSLDNDYFSLAQQLKFLEIGDQAEIPKHFQTLQQIWPTKRDRLSQLLDFNKALSEPEIIRFWETALKSLDADIKSNREDEYITALLKYRLIITEMNVSFNSNIPFT